MKKIIMNKRNYRKRLRHTTILLHDFFAYSSFRNYFKPVLVTSLCLFVLLFLMPALVMQFFYKPDHTPKSSSPSPAFETAALPDNIDVWRTASGKVDTVDFEDYVKGVVSGEMPASFHAEALKAQSVAARTYSAAKVLNAEENGNPQAHPKAPVCDSTHCQVYKSEKELENEKGKKWMKKSWPKICSAVEDTEGELLYYKGQLVEQALFHSSSGGKTENSQDVFTAAVPYLVSVESPYEEEATHQNESNSFSMEEFSASLHSAYPTVNFGEINASGIKILNRSDGGRVDKIQVGEATLTGKQIREALSLPSAKFTIMINGDVITFTSDGSGHGVGLSQYGADGMAKAGYDYKKILSHYYNGVEIF